MPYLIVMNPSAGDDEAAAMLARLARRLADVETVTLGPDLDLPGVVRQGVAEGRIIVAAGGDGTVNAVVQHLGAGGVLGVIPGGTLNHFARDLGIGDEETAIQTLASGRVRPVDMGRCGETAFVNNVALGLYPELVKEREKHEGRLGKWVAAARAGVVSLRRTRPVLGIIAADGDRRGLDAWALFVGNNRYEATAGRIGERQRLDAGVLDVWLLPSVGSRRPGLAWGVFRDATWRTGVVRTEARRVEVELESPRPFAVDGEVEDPLGALAIEILPGALRVLAP
jgi:undecaprenyl-diphosphatase